jgi:type IV secretory pathway TrbD component
MNRKKLLSGSFRLVMIIHILAFTALGLFTAKGWRLLIIFLAGLILLTVASRLLRLYSKRCPDKRRLAKWISILYH